MITCPKCGFKNDQPQATSCPKCGIYYAKFQKAKEHLNAEHVLNATLKKSVSQFDDMHREEFTDLESYKDSNSYNGIIYLSWFFIGFSCVLGLVWVAEIKYFWALINSFEIFKGSEKLVIFLFFAIFSSLPVAVYLAVGGALKLGKDIADNTRATRYYLAHIAKTKSQ